MAHHRLIRVAVEDARRSIMNRSLRPVALVALVAIAVLASACGSSTPGATNSTTSSTASHDQAVIFSQCMRNNGVSNFPDPSAGGPIINVNGAHSIPGFQAALAKCSAIYSSQMGIKPQ